MSARPERSALLGYAQNGLDRLGDRRDDAALMARLREEPAASAFVLAGDIPMLRRSGAGLEALFSLDVAARLGTVREEVFLGLADGRPLFGCLLDPPTPETDQGQDDLLRLDLRSLAVQGLLPAATLGPLGEAKSLLYWHQRHRFCANCGAFTASAAAGWRRDCPSCAAQHFPRVDPVAIMLAVRGESCVLGRQARFAPGMYSCLAGFIEPGETLEDAVRRELGEEAGLTIGRVTYLASQPWPFPSSLMIGCLAEATSETLTVDRQELEDARWFSRSETQAMLAGRHPEGLTSPPAIAIAHHLTRAWAEGELD